jgi:hypothetical protein
MVPDSLTAQLVKPVCRLASALSAIALAGSRGRCFTRFLPQRPQQAFDANSPFFARQRCTEGFESYVYGPNVQEVGAVVSLEQELIPINVSRITRISRKRMIDIPQGFSAYFFSGYITNAGRILYGRRWQC